MVRPSALLLLLPALAACSATPAEERAASAPAAIVGGAVDTKDKAVVYVTLGPDGGGGAYCTGALIAPNLVVTQRICVASSVTGVQCPNDTIGPSLDPGWVDVWGDDVIDGGSTVKSSVSQILVPSDDHVCGADLALLVLATSLPATPLVPRLDQAPVVGEPFTIVGYGDTADNAYNGGTRRSTTATVSCVDGPCADGSLTPGLEFAEGDSHGTNKVSGGDTGAPAIASDGRVFGVNSLEVGGVDYSTWERLDAWGAFIQAGAIAAAKAGGYAPPAWATAPLPEGGAGEGGSAQDAGAGDAGGGAGDGGKGGAGDASSSGSGGSGSGSGSGGGGSGSGSGGSSSGAGTSGGGGGGGGGCAVTPADRGGPAGPGIALAFAVGGLAAVRRRRAR